MGDQQRNWFYAIPHKWSSTTFMVHRLRNNYQKWIHGSCTKITKSTSENTTRKTTFFGEVHNDIIPQHLQTKNKRHKSNDNVINYSHSKGVTSSLEVLI